MAKGVAPSTTLPVTFHWKHLCFLAALPSVNLEVLVPTGSIFFPGAIAGLTEPQEVATRALCTPCAQGCASEESPYPQSN